MSTTVSALAIAIPAQPGILRKLTGNAGDGPGGSLVFIIIIIGRE
jgi:hypothetical protein